MLLQSININQVFNAHDKKDGDNNNNDKKQTFLEIFKNSLASLRLITKSIFRLSNNYK